MASPSASSIWTTFPGLSHLPQFSHAFTLRHPEIEVTVEREEALRRLTAWHHDVVAELGFSTAKFATATQVHGNRVAVVSSGSPEAVPDTDGLISNSPGIILGIYVADCGAVYLADPVSGAFGIVHSGRKGTELNITGEAIAAMQREFGTQPENLVVQLSPCIRPPVFEVDFAADIRRQAVAAGVKPENVHDEGICTSSDPSLYYSYRVEKGKTGRMLALLGRKA
jgi:copper oxidase (laccase) domain-containing protein